VSVEGRIVQLNVSAGGVPKRPVPEARVTALGLEGDAHRNLEHHGGPERAVCLFALERIHALQAEGHPIAPGSIGENVTVEGVDWSRVGPGSRFHLGPEVVVEVTRYTTPCMNIAPAFKSGNFARVSDKRHPGDSRVYARVVQTGTIKAGEAVRLVSSATAPAARG